MSNQSDANQFATETTDSESLQSGRGPAGTSGPYFLLIFRDRSDNHDSQGQERRLEWLDDLRSSGTLLMSGPSRDRTQSICLVKAADIAEAQSLVRSDPWHGLWGRVDVIDWEIHLGLPENSPGG